MADIQRPRRPPINVLLRSAQSGGEVALTDNRIRAGAGGPPLHHHDFDETFHMLEGELTFELGDRLFTRRRGEVAFAPRGVAHTFANLSDSEARTLIVCTPGGFERYFDTIAAREAGVEPPVEAREPWPEVTKVGPSLGDRDLAQIRAAIETGEPDSEESAGLPSFKVVLRSEQSASRISLIEIAVPAGWRGPPLHHHDFDEVFYILDGALTIQLAASVSTVEAGELAFARRGMHHTLANLSDAPARYVLVCTPGGFERYFDRLAAELTGTEPPPEASKPYPETIVVGPKIELN